MRTRKRREEIDREKRERARKKRKTGTSWQKREPGRGGKEGKMLGRTMGGGITNPVLLILPHMILPVSSLSLPSFPSFFRVSSRFSRLDSFLLLRSCRFLSVKSVESVIMRFFREPGANRV
jgi:hypothetical protein